MAEDFVGTPAVLEAAARRGLRTLKLRMEGQRCFDCRRREEQRRLERAVTSGRVWCLWLRPPCPAPKTAVAQTRCGASSARR